MDEKAPHSTADTTREGSGDETHRLLVENSLAGSCIVQSGEFRPVNARFAEILGYDHPKELVGRALWEVVHPGDQDTVRDRGLLCERQQEAWGQVPAEPDVAAFDLERRPTLELEESCPAVRAVDGG